MSSERNRATLIELFENLGPGEEKWCAAYDKALAVDCRWWVQGWPIMDGLSEAKAQVAMLKLVNISANPILEWRNVESFDDDGKAFIFERRGSVADAAGNTLADWDIMGVFRFNEDGKIFAINDYFDGFNLIEAVSKFIPEEQLKYLRQLSRESHPLNPEYKCDPQFYQKMYENMLAGSA